MPINAPNLPIFDTNIAIFPFVLLPFVSRLAVVTVGNNKPTPAFDTAKINASPFFAVKHLSFPSPADIAHYQLANYLWLSVESQQVNWLINHFNQWFAHYETILVKGEHEPEYFAKTDSQPAKIVFAHGFFASSLHEISHWCVAGKKRRQLNDFGYWYAPDGRNQDQQQLFEQVEIMPQAIECLLSLACNKPFKVSKDNLFANFDTSQSTFTSDVKQQAVKFWQKGEKLPKDATFLIQVLSKLRPIPLTTVDIERNFFDSLGF